MDPDSSASPAAAGSTTRLVEHPLPLTESPPRVAASRPDRFLRDVRLLRSPTMPGRDSDRAKAGHGPPGFGLGKTTPWGSARSRTKPLLPVTERRSHEEILAARRGNKGSQDDDKWDVAPDGGSAGREGRQFAVANVGNNGRIYLR